MVYLCTDLIAAPGRWSRPREWGLHGLRSLDCKPELAYLARAQVIVGSNPTRPTIHPNLGGVCDLFPWRSVGAGTFAAARQSYFLEVRSLTEGPRSMRLTADHSLL